MRGNDAIMTRFDKTLNIKRLYFHYFSGVAITLILRRRYSAMVFGKKGADVAKKGHLEAIFPL